MNAREYGSYSPEEETTPESTEIPQVPEAECRVEMSRGSGSGGQKRNKTSNRIQLWWNPDNSTAFTLEQKEKIKERCANRMNKAGEIFISSENERSMEQNKSTAFEILNGLVAQALTPEKERIETQPTKGSKERRLGEKEKHGRKKAQRQWRHNE
ncbi:MAG: alternative ribosome rescue aminoacyl-tRNA hydrolase ArfB [bacterium]|nr:alternative ribosome rescue aminoacyl-tRNA hydrolase ArfB [bacterium]